LVHFSSRKLLLKESIFLLEKVAPQGKYISPSKSCFMGNLIGVTT